MDSSPPTPADPEIASRHETVAALAQTAKRTHVPIRNAFVQRARDDGEPTAPRAGPLAEFVSNGDHRGLLAYLLLHTVASSEPWDVVRRSEVWARALGIEHSRPSAAMSKVWRRLADRELIARERNGREARLILLKEDGTGEQYTRPDGKKGDRYFQLSHEFWISDLYVDLNLAGTAALLIAAHEKPRFKLPFERAPQWYGISADTMHRGFDQLVKLGLIHYRRTTRKEPLAPEGFVQERVWRLQPPFARKTTS